MQSRWMIPAAIMAVSAWAGFALGERQSDTVEAQNLLRLLRANEIVYQNALEFEAESLTQAEQRLRDANGLSGGPMQAAARELAQAEKRFQELHAKLSSARVKSDVRREYLDPILAQIGREQVALESIRVLILSSHPDDVAEARMRLERYQHPPNLFTEAIRGIRKAFGVARPRFWHGRPLTA